MDDAPRRAKLGLALAGGGFRASLFHVGVLRRMAELDLLRYVEVLSTVSGGSIIGALYILLLKLRLENAPSGRLNQPDYVALADDLAEILLDAIRRDLRARLLWNPLRLLRVLLTQYTLGQGMGRLYEKHIYRRVTRNPAFHGAEGAERPDTLALREVRVRPGMQPMAGGIESYNMRVTTAEPAGSAVTNQIVNATSLNSGARFWFAASEVGDWYLGHVRHSEIPLLLARKRLLELTDEEFERVVAAPPAPAADPDLGPLSLSFARWWRHRRAARPSATPVGWEPLFQASSFPGRLVEDDVSLGQLRLAKLPAWYLRRGRDRQPPVEGGASPDEHRRRFWDELDVIDDRLSSEAFPEDGRGGVENLLLEFVLELYWCRSAELVSHDVERFWRGVTLGDAVAASACFPPVFSPIVIHRVYDDWHVSRLALADGGVYDNIGLTALLDEHCTQIIASDTSGLLGITDRAATGRIGMMARIANILSEAVAERERNQLRAERRATRDIAELAAAETGSEQAWPAGTEVPAWTRLREKHSLDALAFFHIKSQQIGDGLDLGINPDDLARIRTDLDGFGEVECDALINHGYNMADRYLREYFKDTACARRQPDLWKPPERPPRLLEPDARVHRILRAGRMRFFRALALGNPVSWVFTVALLGLVIWRTWSLRFSLSGALGWLTGAESAAEGWVVQHIGWPGHRPVSIGAALLVLALAILVRLLWPWAIDRLRGARRHRPARRLAVVGRVARGYLGNLLWPLAAFPLVLTITVSLAAWVSYLVFYLPFRWSSRNLTATG